MIHKNCFFVVFFVVWIGMCQTYAMEIEEKIVRVIKKSCPTLHAIESYEQIAQEASAAGDCGYVGYMNHLVRALGRPINGSDSLTQAAYKCTIFQIKHENGLLSEFRFSYMGGGGYLCCYPGCGHREHASLLELVRHTRQFHS